MKKCAFIYNPESGHLKNKRLIYKMMDVLKTYDYMTDLYKTEYPKHAEKIVKDLEYYDLVICAGGDGTLNEAIEGNIKRERRLLLAHLPFGTSNDVGHMYGYSKNHLKDLHMLLKGDIKNVDVCKINDKYFIYVACFGNFIDVSFKTPRKWKKQYGRLAYIYYGVQKLAKEINTTKIKYTIDGEVKEGDYSFIFVTNSSRVAGVNNLYRDVKLDDNMFEVALCKSKNRRELFGVLSQLLVTSIDKIEGFEYYRTNNFKIEFENISENSWGVDGEEYHTKSNYFDFTITKEVQMMLPKKNFNKLFEDK
ncbi:MAG: diacylglycerol kinase family lipid kinase [Bacilli bacterium]|nr:diacylglycerol kinase family lipid kinase [Bacilli bacterium]